MAKFEDLEHSITKWLGPCTNACYQEVYRAWGKLTGAMGEEGELIFLR